MNVCEDPRAPALAKATAGVAITRAAGLFEKAKDLDENEPHEMKWEELNRTANKAQRELQARGIADDRCGMFD